MPKKDDLKDRLEELFSSSSIPEGLPEAQQTVEFIKEIKESVKVEPAAKISEQAPDNETFRVGFENASMGLCLTGVDGLFIRTNRAFGELLGYSLGELAGKSSQQLTFIEDIQVGAEAMRAMIAGETDRARFQKRYIHSDGHPIWVELNVALLRDKSNEPLYFFTLVQDITEQQYTADLLEKRVSELNCLNDIGHKIDERPSLVEFLQWVTERIPAATQYPKDCVVAVEYEGVIFGKPEALNYSSKIVGGLRVAGELVGWLHIAYTQPRDFIDAESALVGGIVSRIAGFLETIRQQKQAQRHSEELSLLNEMGRSLTSILDLDMILENVYRYSTRLIDVTNYLIALYEKDTGIVSFPVAYNENEPVEMPSHPLRSGLIDYIIRTGEPLLLSDNVTEGIKKLGIEFVAFRDDTPALSWLGVPIKYGNQVLGVITTQSVTIPGCFQERDRNVLISVSQLAANAIAISRQFEQIRDQIKREQMLRQITTLVRGSMDPEVVLKTAVRELGTLLGRKTFVRLGDVEALSRPPERGREPVLSENGEEVRNVSEGAAGTIEGGR